MSLHGLLLLDKPQGLTSHDVVARVRRTLNMKSIGHCGTLDPMATGLMVLLLGEATKISAYLLERDKSYRVRAQLGVRTDTLDMTGTVLEEKSVDVSEARVSREALALQGEMQLPVPIFSAVKVQGEKLYEKARRQEQVETPVKTMRFYDLKVVGQGPDWLEADIHCSKGSYIRTWVDLLGQRLGTGAAMSALRRTSSQPFRLEEAITLDELAKAQEQGKAPEKGFLPLPLTLPHWKVIRVAGPDLALIKNGQISHAVKTRLISLFQPGTDEGVKILARDGGELLALIGLEPERGFVVRRVFRY